jgi:hypothetical protein
MVKCKATVEPKGDQQYLVDVWGEEPHNHKRQYVINSDSEDKAAMEGISRFVAEMEQQQCQ